METTLQVNKELLKELMTDICAEVKHDMRKIRADLITQCHAMEKKIVNCMSVIREELKTQIGDL